VSPEVEPLGNPEERARRYRRFEQLFSALGSLGDRINEVIDTEALKLKKEHGPVLSLVIALSFGKALKTLQATDRLCLMGYGEDALVLLRSNVNLLINTAYILSGPDPTERAKDFLAYSVRERVKFLKNTYQQAPPWQLPMPPDEIKARADRWGNIADRAKAIPPFHYVEAYKLYSSFEHSDVFALDHYFTEWSEIGPKIEAGESDAHVGLALGHSYGVMADIFTMALRFFRIDRPDIERELRETWPTLKPDAEA
jgi:hypothetical protein